MASSQTKLFATSEEKLAALDGLFLKSEKYRNSQEYFNLLNFINKFPKLSPFNAFLIHTQNSGVEVVLTAFQWSKFSRKVKYNARPLVILVPFGPVNFVYDIADTEGEDIPAYMINPFTTYGKLKSSIYNYTTVNCIKEEIMYIEDEMHKSSAGFSRRKLDEFSVHINKGYSIEEKYSTLVHELAHIFCGHLGINNKSWWRDRQDITNSSKEIEAESISFLVCKRNGLQTTSEAYLSAFVTNNKIMPDISLDIVITVAGYIEQMGKSGFKSKSKKIK